MQSEKNKFPSIIKLLIKCVFVFGFIYDVNFAFLPSITTARLCLITLIAVSILKKKHIPRIAKSFLLLSCFILIIALFQFAHSSDSTQISRIIWFTLYGILAPFLFTDFLKSRNEYLHLISIAVGIQAILTILSFFVPSVKSLFYDLIIYTSNYGQEVSIRAAGFASIGGAGLSVIQSIGIITILIILKTNTYGFYKSFLLWVLIIIIIISMILVGRTGLFVSFFCIFLYFASEIKNIKNIILLSIVVFIICQLNLLAIFEKLTMNISEFDMALFTDWIEGAFQLKNNKTAEILSNMPIPPISPETLLGTGMVVNPSGIGNASGHDSGYIQTYYSLGLLTAIFFYITYLSFLIRQVPKKYTYLYVLILIMFVIEIKEPFIFQYVFPFFVLSTILVIKKFGVVFLKRKRSN